MTAPPVSLPVGRTGLTLGEGLHGGGGRDFPGGNQSLWVAPHL